MFVQLSLKKIQFPIVIRPSYVLCGRAMRIINNELELEKYFYSNFIENNKAILIDEFLLGAKETVDNNVLAVKLNDRGLLSEKKFFTINDMEQINFDKSTTLKTYDKNSYLFNVLTSLREKINSPSRKKAKTN